MFERDQLFIGGGWVEPSGASVIEVISPSTEEIVGRVPEATEADIDRAVEAARAAFDRGPWPRMAAAERAEVMEKLSGLLQARSEELARTITEQNGSPISWSIMGQVFASTMVLDFYTGLARTYQFEEDRAGVMGPTIVRKEPVGVVGAIVPWNVPLFTTMLKLGPAFAAGCTVVLKPAPETPLDAYILAECCLEAGLPEGVLNIVPAGREVGEHLVTRPQVDKIAFTGSSAAGMHIASLCGRQLKRYTLELGGKSAAIILDDADIADLVPKLVPAAMMNNGQACVAQTRVLISRDRHDELVDALSEAVRTLKVGDPLDAATEVGPLTAERQRERVLGYINVGQEEGAKLAVGGGRPGGLDRGWYVEPTVFVNVDNKMTIAQEEIFGPVMSVIPFDDERQAIDLANDSVYGLSGSVYSADTERALDVARLVRTGTISINGFSLDFGSPFGGYKQSGVGRELGPEGLEHYLEYKSVMFPGGR